MTKEIDEIKEEEEDEKAAGPDPTRGKGRPRDYNKDTAEGLNALATKLCLLGQTNKELAAFFGISLATLYNWMNDFPDFLDAVLEGKEVADANVTAAFYKKCTGYEVDEEKLWCFEGHVTRADTIKHIVPDASACLNWLKNRQPAKWRDAKDIDHSGKVELVRITDDITEDDCID